jgi:hypothetical protein
MTDGTTAAAPPADRYGRRPARRRHRSASAVVAAAVAVVGVSWAAWTAFGPRNAVRWSDGTLAVVDDGHATLSFDVTMAPGSRAVCTVRLFNGGMTEVGRKDVAAGPSDRRTFSVTASVPTFETASSGTVRACMVQE